MCSSVPNHIGDARGWRQGTMDTPLEFEKNFLLKKGSMFLQKIFLTMYSIIFHQKLSFLTKIVILWGISAYKQAFWKNIFKEPINLPSLLLIRLLKNDANDPFPGSVGCPIAPNLAVAGESRFGEAPISTEVVASFCKKLCSSKIHAFLNYLHWKLLPSASIKASLWRALSSCGKSGTSKSVRVSLIIPSFCSESQPVGTNTESFSTM